MNTVTTVLTYLVVFLIQNTQNRDSQTIHLKLNELISSIEGARNRIIDLQLLRKSVSRGEVGDAAAVSGEPDRTRS